MTEIDRSYLTFGDRFERRFVGQVASEERSIDETLEIGWDLLSVLPTSELQRVTREELEQHYRPEGSEGKE